MLKVYYAYQRESKQLTQKCIVLLDKSSNFNSYVAFYIPVTDNTKNLTSPSWCRFTTYSRFFFRHSCIVRSKKNHVNKWFSQSFIMIACRKQTFIYFCVSKSIVSSLFFFQWNVNSEPDLRWWCLVVQNGFFYSRSYHSYCVWVFENG